MARDPKLVEKVSDVLSGRAPGSLRAAKARWKWSNPDLAERMSGTRDKRSREYKNAIRRVQRAEKAGKLTPEIRKVLQSETEKRGWDRVRRRGLSNLNIKSGTYWVSNRDKLISALGDGFRSLEGIKGSAFAGVVEALEEARLAQMTGDEEGAAEALANANDLLEEVVSEAYGMAGGSVAHFTDVGDIDLTIR